MPPKSIKLLLPAISPAAAGISLGTAAWGVPLVFAPLAMVVLILDASRGVLHAVRPLPVTRRAQAATWWLLGVVLVPMVAIVPLLAGDLIYLATHPLIAASLPLPPTVVGSAPVAQNLLVLTPAYSPWFASAVQWWVGLGYGALCFLLAMLLPTRPAVGLWENLGTGFVGVLWGLSMPALPWLTLHLPQNLAKVAPWHWAVFGAVPFCVVLSFLAAPDMIQRRLVTTGRVAKTEARDEARAGRRGLTGVPLYLAMFVGRMVLVLVFMAIFQNLFYHLISGHRLARVDPMIAGQAATFAIILGAFSVEGIGLRTLRALPLSTMRLAALLLAMPVVLGLCGAGITAGWGGLGDPAWPRSVNYAAQALALAGCGALALAISLHIVSGARLIVPVLLSLTPTLGFFIWKNPAVLATAGGLALAAAFALLHRGLRRSPAFYQPRRLFSMSVGQPMAVR